MAGIAVKRSGRKSGSTWWRSSNSHAYPRPLADCASAQVPGGKPVALRELPFAEGFPFGCRCCVSRELLERRGSSCGLYRELSSSIPFRAAGRAGDGLRQLQPPRAHCRHGLNGRHGRRRKARPSRAEPKEAVRLSSKARHMPVGTLLCQPPVGRLFSLSSW